MSQSHRFQFSRTELTKIKQLLREIRGSDSDQQKLLRGQLRRIGFYITDYAVDQAGFTASDVDKLIANGAVTITDSPVPAPTSHSDRHSNGFSIPRTAAREAQAPRQATQGHRRSIDWMGIETETLEDLVRPGLTALCIGINPAPTSVAIGHYYQGRLGGPFFDRLKMAGAVSFTTQAWQDDEAYEQGFGFTDIVKRPTARADEATVNEFQHGKGLLLAKISNHNPRILIFSFKKAAEALFGSFASNGIIADVGNIGPTIFVMPGPYAKREEVTSRLIELSRLFRV